MKKRLLILLLTLVLLVSAISLVASAATVASGKCGDKLSWVLDSNGKLTISGSGAMYNYSSGNSPWDDYRWDITSVVVKSGVTSIGNYAFYWCDMVTVSLPDTLTRIGVSSFTSCDELISVYIPNSVSFIGQEAFYHCDALSEVHLPTGLTTLGEDAFQACDALETIAIPGHVNELSWTFFGCDSLHTIYFLGNAPSFDGNVFNDVTATAYYCPDKYGWSSSVLKDYGGDITWVTYYPVIITKQPTNVKVANGKKATVSVGATGPGLTYTWYVKDPGASSFTKSSITGSSYSVQMNSARNGRQVYCKVMDKYDIFLTTDTVTMSMAAAPKITKQPVSVTVGRESTAKVSLTASGEGLTYKWYYKDKGASAFKYTSTFKGASYSTTMNDARNGRQLYCVVTDKYGQTVKSKVVTISAPSTKATITKQPVSVCVANGANAKVTVTATGKDLTYKWYYKDKGASAFKYTSTFKGTSYSTTMNASRSGRQLYCVVTDKYGQTVTTKTVTISMKVAITKQPVGTSVAMDNSITASVSATGEGLKYQWYFCNPGTTNFNKSSVTTSSYTFTMSAKNDGRKIYCVITDKFGNTAKSNTITFKSKVAITAQPQDAAAIRGDSVTATVNATGSGLKYQWYFSNPGTTTFHKSSVTTKDYTFTMNDKNNGRRVYCVVTDKYGKTAKSDIATFTVLTATITEQPVNVNVPLGEMATVSVTAIGEGLTYQWFYRNPGSSTFAVSSVTTSTYSYEMTAAKSGRKVYCVVTDVYGNSVTSNTVTMKKKTELSITKQPSSVTVTSGETATVSFTAVGDGLKYTWYVKDPGASSYTKSSVTKSSYSAQITSAKNGRQVYCVVTDAYGNSVQTNTVTMNMRSALAITKQPSSVTVSSGSYATVSLTATGDGLSYTWYYRSSSSSYYYTSSSTTSTYSRYMYSGDTYYVYCVVTDKYGNSVTSSTATLRTTSSDSGSGSSSSSYLSYITGNWTSVYMLNNGSGFYSSAWRINIYSSGTAYLYMTSSSASGSVTYKYKSGTKYYYYIGGSIASTFCYDSSTRELCMMIDNDSGVFFEK